MRDYIGNYELYRKLKGDFPEIAAITETGLEGIFQRIALGGELLGRAREDLRRFDQEEMPECGREIVDSMVRCLDKLQIELDCLMELLPEPDEKIADNVPEIVDASGVLPLACSPDDAYPGRAWWDDKGLCFVRSIANCKACALLKCEGRLTDAD
jgi:hypothetical protein